MTGSHYIMKPRKKPITQKIVISTTVLSAEAMFKFCEQPIIAIKFIYVTEEEMEQTRKKLADRFSISITVPGTRSFHQIVPLSKSMVSMKRIYHDDDFALEFDILKSKKKYECMQIENVKISQILLCKYDELCWIGMVSEIDFLNYDFKIKFMHPIIPSRFYNRPNWDHPYLCFLDDNTTFLGRMHR